MRDIKFRGKSIDNREWVYGDLLIQKNSEQCLIRTYDTELQEYVFHEVSPETVGQYIGFKDDCNKEIYEGDIVKCYVDGKQYLAKVLFRGGCFMFKIPRFPWYGGLVDTANFEVVGNIYENPELLEDE